MKEKRGANGAKRPLPDSAAEGPVSRAITHAAPSEKSEMTRKVKAQGGGEVKELIQSPPIERIVSDDSDACEEAKCRSHDSISEPSSMPAGEEPTGEEPAGEEPTDEEPDWTWGDLARREDDEASELNQSLVELARIISAPEGQHNAESLTRILNEHPEHAERRDGQGFLPLSLAVIDRAPLAIVQILAEAYPEGVIANYFRSDEYANVHHFSVLHDAVELRLEAEHVTCLLDTAMSHLCSTLTDGWGCIHSFFADHIKLDGVIERLLADFPELPQQDGDISPEYYDEGDTYALHYAVDSEASIATIERVLHLWPDALVTEGDYGRSPLQVLMEWEQSHDRDDANQERFYRLLKLLSSPEALRLCDDDGMLPLHFYCSKANSDEESSCGTLDLHAVQFLVQSYPESVETLDNNGRTPLHLACSGPKDGNLALINYLVQAYPRALRVRDGNGLTPLQTLSSSEAAIRLRDSFGQNVLHALARHCISTALLQCLMEERPELVRETDNDDRLPLNIAFVNHDQARAESMRRYPSQLPCLHSVYVPVAHWLPGVRCLFEAFPEGACQVDNSSTTPLMLACERNFSTKFIYQLVKANPALFDLRPA